MILNFQDDLEMPPKKTKVAQRRNAINFERFPGRRRWITNKGDALLECTISGPILLNFAEEIIDNGKNSEKGGDSMTFFRTPII